MANEPLTPEQMQQQAEANRNLTDSNNNLAQSQINTSETANQAGLHLGNLGNIVVKNTGLFNLFGNAILGSQKALGGFNNIDPTSITTFSSHFGDLKDALNEGGPVAKAAENALKSFGARLEAADPTKFIGASKATVGALLGILENYTKNADAAIRFQGAMLQSAAATGEFGKIMEKAGPDMEKINTIMMNQIDMMDKAGAVTNKSREQMNRYYQELRTVPGALGEMVNMTAQGTTKTDMLTAAIRLADGTGQNYTDVIKSLHHSFSDFGVSGEKALRFTAQFSEIANKYGLELEDVRSGLMGAASAFKDMTNAGESAANMQDNISKLMDTYVQRLKDAGMTGRHAIEVFKGMTTNLSGLTIAQKAFLSAQTGGPGGLMGGFQIEKMIQQGDIEGLQKKMMQVMQKQFGKVVTLDEATKSQAAAAQLEKQTLMLRQGPMGQIVKSDQDAYKFLDAMKAQQEGRAVSKGAIGLDQNVLQKSMEKGSVWEQKTHTLVSNISADVRELRNHLLGTSLESVQRELTSASLPTQGVRTGDQLKAQENLKRNTLEAETAAAKHAAYRQTEMKSPGMITDDRSKMYRVEAEGNLEKHLKQFPTAVKSVIDNVSQEAGNKAGVKPTAPDLNADTERRRQDLVGRTTPKAPAAPAAPPGRQLGVATRKVVSENMSSLDPKNFGEVKRPSAVVGAAPRGTPTAPRGSAGAGTVPAPPSVTVEQPSNSGRFKVHVTVTEDKSDNSRSVYPGPGT